jgi:DNA helicase TIP49 (TBP-interacting protein)
VTTAYIIFDKRSGQIINVHYGDVDAEKARGSAQHHRRHDARVSEEHVAVMPLPSGPLDKEKLYKVDVARNALVVAAAEEGGVSFSFGASGGLPIKGA